MKIRLILVAIALFSLHLPSSAQKLKNTGDTQKGKASYYHSKFHGRKTASGELYDKFKLTAAHRTLPYGTMIKVTNQRNDKAIIVKVNDRGPYSKGRIVDLSFAAASRIDMIKEGVSNVEVEVISMPDDKKEAKKEEAKEEDEDKKEKETEPKEKSEEEEKDSSKEKESSKEEDSKKEDKKSSKLEDALAKGLDKVSEKAEKAAEKIVEKVDAVVTKRVAPKNFKTGKTYNPEGVEQSPRGYGIQIAAYYDATYATKIAQEAINLGLKPVFVQTGWSDGRQMFRVIYGAEKSANKMRKDMNIVQSKGFAGFIQPHFKK